MESRQTDPVLKTRVESKYGRRDFERFDDVASSHVRAGHATIGKVEIDCKFIFRKSRWGVLGPNRHPGGIVYIDLDIVQPSDCRLRSATVEVILEEDRQPTAAADTVRSRCPVKFTDNYGPKSLSGPERVERIRQLRNGTPMVNVLGNGAGGLGIDIERTRHTSSRWKFAGHITSSAGCFWYNKLRWDLDENGSEPQSLHSNVIHTAFALDHNAEKFYIKVNVRGKLTAGWDRVKNKMKFGKEEEIVTTMIEWKNGYHFPKVLDQLAESLPFDMQRENLANVSMEVPDAFSASFAPAATLTPATNNSQASPFRVIEELGHSNPLGHLSGAHPLLRITEPQPEPTVESMETAAGLLALPPAETPAPPIATATAAPPVQTAIPPVQTATPPVETGRRASYPRSESRFSEAVTLVENGEGRNGRTVSFTPKLKHAEDEDDDAEVELFPVNQKRPTPIGDLFGLLVVLSWLGNIRFLCVATVYHIFRLPWPERYGADVKAVEKQEARQRPQVNRPSQEVLNEEDDSAGETIASVSPTIPRREFIRGRPRERVSFVQAVK